MGGQVAITSEVENYPAFPEGTTGPELVDLMRRQAEKFGARIEIDEIIEVNFTKGSPFYLKTHGQEYLADAVIITTGALPRRLGVPGEDEFIITDDLMMTSVPGVFAAGEVQDPVFRQVVSSAGQG